ncbi:hypothetical protein [Arthrobacter sp. H20]|uniref:hypothetical protein n=1 Tax=Arthrobacter sp. H20 TaxID=1267981 RepID=UPI0006881C77|nr:hypothetical protein [Arthrobacter sp. H20]
MVSRFSSSKLGRSNMRASAVLGVAALVLTGGSPATAASPVMTSVAATADSAASAQGEASGNGHGKAKGNTTQAFDRQVEKATQFMRTAADDSTYFDTDAAHAANADTATLEMGTIINQLAASQQPASDGQISIQASLPIWGNWCGPGHGGGVAVDVLDSICRTHDRCYGSRGYFACSCDRAIVRDIRANAYRMKTQERAVAAAVSTYFTYCLCNPLK